jgi:hypothetical protein
MTDQELYEEGWERFPWVCSLQTPLHLPGQGRQADVKVRGSTRKYEEDALSPALSTDWEQRLDRYDSGWKRPQHKGGETWKRQTAMSIFRHG